MRATKDTSRDEQRVASTSARPSASSSDSARPSKELPKPKGQKPILQHWTPSAAESVAISSTVLGKSRAARAITHETQLPRMKRVASRSADTMTGRLPPPPPQVKPDHCRVIERTASSLAQKARPRSSRLPVADRTNFLSRIQRQRRALRKRAMLEVSHELGESGAAARPIHIHKAS